MAQYYSDPNQSEGEGRAIEARPSTLTSLFSGNWVVPYIFLLPSLVFLAIFTLWPIISVVWTSFYARRGRNEIFVGFQNYNRMLSDPVSQQVLTNTIMYVTAGLVISILGGLMLAILLNQKIPFISLFRFPFLVTIALPMISVASIWLFLYSPRVGLFNEILKFLGLPPSNWLSDRDLALPLLLVVYLWKQLGYFALFYLAALQAIPDDVLEAARLEGITFWEEVRYIIWPLVSPTTYFLSTIAVLNALQQIDHIFILTGGGPNNATNMSLYYVYEQGFKYFNSGIASAMTVILLSILLTMAILQYVYLERHVHYE